MMTKEKTEVSYVKEWTCRAVALTIRKQGIPLRKSRGFTLVELLVSVAIMGILAGLAIPAYKIFKESARESAAMTEIRTIELAIAGYLAENGRLPAGLSDVKYDTLLDPWKNRYQYVLGAGTLEYISGSGIGNMEPLAYDLWSQGRDSSTGTILSDEVNKNIIVRAENGAFVGLAQKYGTIVP